MASVLVCLPLAACATTTCYARRPEAERSAYVAASALKNGMTLHDVIVVMLNSRRPSQYASLESSRSCPEVSVDLIAHAGELLAKVGATRVYAGGFASIQTLRDRRFKSEGFERAATLLDAIRSRESELLACREATLMFDAVTEGACGRDRIGLMFSESGALATIGKIEWSECVAPDRGAPSTNELQRTRPAQAMAPRR